MPIDGLLSDSAKLLEYLECSDPRIRAATIGLIVHFSDDCESYKDILVELLKNERQHSMRALLVTALGCVYAKTKDTSLQSVFKRLILDDKESPEIRRKSYLASLSSEYVLKNGVSRGLITFPGDVDWEYVARLKD
jgi:hypothetical protein